MSSMFARTTLPFVLAVAFGCFASSVDLHNSEEQAAALVLVVGGFLLGMIWPAKAWRWALVLGLAIILGDSLAPRLGLIARDVEPINWGALIALIPAFMGTYAGVGVQAMMRAATAKLG